jgi:hypothetical protein
MTTHHLTPNLPTAAPGSHGQHYVLADRDADGIGYSAPFRHRRRMVSAPRAHHGQARRAFP